MHQRLDWFERLPAEQRAGVLLVTQTGVGNFAAWLTRPGESIRLTAEAFRIAPRDLARRLSLRQTVELVRVATDVFEQHLPPLAADDDERRVLVEGVLRFGREIAIAAATVYANAAETRGAWDARLEALVVDAVVRGEADDAMVSRAAALGFDPAAAVLVVVGSTPVEAPEEALGELRRHAHRSGRSVLVGVQGQRLIVLLSEPSGPSRGPGVRGLGRLVDDFGPGPVVLGPPVPDLRSAHTSAREALAGLRAAPGRPDAPRPVDADDLLPERALCGDAAAHRALAALLAPLHAAGGALLDTLTAYLDGGGALESCARALFVHPNTVRYRLRRVSELTGRVPTEPRDAQVLRTALVAARLDADELRNPYNERQVGDGLR
ncbi:helix-turn-helix domain-containing protein [Pseudonocardia petroleophila]|uniref:Helix-turn-helix domain-containing protein n=2 Tax=Pseudonocardia petroleophila TaxID=37331 RepID=A0A7G7MSA5_9PSEU|nr:helix-turn-helix domain-containing protein [Pseudonocardia petroleophila]